MARRSPGAGSRLPFDERDPFNDHRVRGYVIRSRRRRGDLEITHVDDHPCPQYVRGTPRIRHLRDDERPPAPLGVQVYDKLDGTNVLMFRYRDRAGGTRISYKTRHRPFLCLQPYGDFVAMWERILQTHADAMRTLLDAPYSFAFELFGSLIPQLTDHEVQLDARLLFALDPDHGRMLPPDTDPQWAFPTPEFLATFDHDADPMEVHGQVTSLVERRHLDGGSEGAVLFFMDREGASLRKCKPAAVRRSQALYRDLYGHAKQLVREQLADSTIGAVSANVAEGIADFAQQRNVQGHEHRVVGIVQEHIRLELQATPPPTVAPIQPRGLDEPGSRLLWRTVWGSHMWGMDTPSSDRDRCAVYLADSDVLLLGAFEPERLALHRRGQHGKTPDGDLHVYELGRLVQLLLRGSLTVLYGVISPVVEVSHPALTELRELLQAQPSTVFHRGLLRHVRDSEGYMARADTAEAYRKHLRIAVRNLEFAHILFSEGRFALGASTAETAEELEVHRARMSFSHRNSRFPEAMDPAPFHAYLLRWRHHAWP